MNFQNNFQKSFTAKKSLGQNFLHAPHVISAMVHAGGISGDSAREKRVLEVGPGKGALTAKLLETGAHVVAVEKDDRAIPFLSEKFAGEIAEKRLEIIHMDILEFNTDILKNNYTIIANIPYYITGEFLRKFLGSDTPPERIVVMLQKEVAKRITDTKESILSLSVKAYGTPKYLVSVPRKFFRPMPNVDSAVLVIENISKKFFSGSESGSGDQNRVKIAENRFFEVIKAGFAHKRKVVVKNLEEKIGREVLEKIWENEKLSKNARAEDIPLEMWKRIIGYNPIP